MNFSHHSPIPGPHLHKSSSDILTTGSFKQLLHRLLSKELQVNWR